MMRSLWAGVTGLQAHQIAMDVEGNNIANVNTAGFKYSRANFSDMLSQTSKIATAPQGELGGKNAMQIGLGTQVSSITKIFKQGSVQTTDKNTDLAIQGDGFFVVSPDGGSTYKYTRNGDFTFDAKGNFADSNGYIIQGWLKNNGTGDIDATTPIANITIPPGLTTPAQDTSYITLKANLNSGDTVGTKSTIYSLDQYHEWVDTNDDGIVSKSLLEDHVEDKGSPIFDVDQNVYEKGTDFGTLFNASGEALKLESGQGVWISFADSKLEMYAVATAPITPIKFELNGKSIDITLTGKTSADNAAQIKSAINAISTETGISATSDNYGKVTLINKNDTGSTTLMKNIKFSSDGSSGLYSNSDNSVAAPDTTIITAFQYEYGASPSSGNERDSVRIFNTTEDLRYMMQDDARNYTDYLGNGFDDVVEKKLNKNDGVQVIVNSLGQYQITNPGKDAFNVDDGDFWNPDDLNEIDTNHISFPTTQAFGDIIGPIDISAVAAPYTITFPEGTIVPQALADEITALGLSGISIDAITNAIVGGNVTLDQADATHAAAIAELDSGSYVLGSAQITAPANTTVSPTLTRALEFTGGTSITYGFSLPPNTSVNIPKGTKISTLAGVVDQNLDPTKIGTDGIVTESFTITDANNATLETLNFLIPVGKSMTLPIGTSLDSNLDELNNGGDGKITLQAGVNYNDDDDKNMNITITSLVNEKSANTNLTAILSAMQGALTTDSTGRTSQSLYSATHASSIDVYDSLGTKHTVRIDFRKSSVSKEGTQWDVKITVPKPGEINPSDSINYNILTGSIKFGSNGALEYFTPTSIAYTANNGSSPDQNILINLGTIGQFDGMTSFDAESNTSGISQDGYTGGDLSGVRIDETGTVIGSFTNGRSFGLAQVAMASFSNNEGLESDGGNTFVQTSNSGDPIIGQAAVGGRGFVQASSLEMSNVDLSRSLTQLIVIQRGYQANSKTITTADQLLQTLLQLKQ